MQGYSGMGDPPSISPADFPANGPDQYGKWHINWDALARKLGKLQVRDEGQMQAWVTQAFAANERAVRDALGNPKRQQKAKGFLTGQVMQLSGGQADPKIVGELIERKLAELADS